MTFNSFEFIFLFLPAFLVLHTFIKNTKIKNIVLICFSIFFYSWGEPKYILYLLLMIMVCYILSYINSTFKNKFIIALSVVLLVGPLVFFKYFSETMPLGISFFTFQMLSYQIDVYRNKIAFNKNPLKLIVYLSLFMAITSGPIIRYSDIEEKLNNRTVKAESIEKGLCRFILGLFKKVVIADGVAKIADIAFSMNVHTIPLTMSWLGAISYMIQIYYDFSGYSDMAIGIGMMAGFEFKENFMEPYSSVSITDFWRRWHISLGSWFRDYVYIPLGGNRVSVIHWVFNILIVWALTGIWHGTAMNYILWGLYFGVILILEKKVLKDFLNQHKMLAHIYTLLIILGGWIIFRIENIADLPYYVFSMIDIRTIGTVFELLSSNMMLYLIYLLIGIVLLLPGIHSKLINIYKSDNYFSKFLCLLMFLLAIIYIENSSYTAFLYFKF